jgi:16S rRNA (guanine527-N7)-methyltransferase
MSIENLRTEIQHGCSELGLRAGQHVVDNLVKYIELLDKWNRVYNLTAVRKPTDMVTRHILDSLAVVPYLGEGRLLDIGTGAGLPGIPIALFKPELSLTLLDSNAKKMRFVRQAVTELALENVHIVNQRAEQYQPAQAFDMVISRAVSSVQELYDQTKQLVRPGGLFLFMKGAYPEAEIDAFEASGQLHVESLQVPGLQAERHLVCLVTDIDPLSESGSG